MKIYLRNAFVGMTLAAALTLPALAQTDPQPKSEVGKRAENQQDRIAQGVKSGQLTPRETANLESKDARVNREIHNDRAANGGKLTGAEKARVNSQQNRVSQKIYRDKHNGRTQ